MLPIVLITLALIAICWHTDRRRTPYTHADAIKALRELERLEREAR